jgi:hypothetical protein
MKQMTLRTRMAAAATAAGLAATMGIVSQTPYDAMARATTGQHVKAHHRNSGALRTPPAIKLRNEMRVLWEDHVTWTRMFIVSAIGNLPDKDAAAARLLANQDDIGDAIKPYYGKAAGEKLSFLLRDHILIAAEIIDAARNGDTAGVEDANARWHTNSNEIADFLSAANPDNWRKSEMRKMMADHLKRTLAEASARLNGDWDADIAAYDGIHRQALHMADMLSFGIIRQFPRQF